MFPAQAALVGEVLPEITLARTQVAQVHRVRALLAVALMAYLATTPLAAAVEPVLLVNHHQVNLTLLAA
jgi:hypothetical protein